ncbi:MAG: hypothetical protein WC901_00810 [Candidatus Margulisiibacteriota bacterium]
MKIKVEKLTLKYSNGVEVRCGKWKIGSVVWNSSGNPKGDNGEDLKYKAHCRLPGIKEFVGNFETEQKGVEKLQSVLDYWIKGLEQ